MGWLFALDTCGIEGGVALADSATGDIVARRTLPGRETQERLMSAMSEVLAEASLRPTHLNYLAITHGPGSFTGIRIGLAAVKGLAEALDLPVVAISRLQLLALRSSVSTRINAWLDAGRGDVYIGQYQDGVCLREAMYPRDAARALEGEIVVGEDLLRNEGRFVGLPTVDDLVRQATSRIASDVFSDVVTLDANYLRVPDAELALQQACKARQ